jgi:hypothetical protein
MTVLDMIAGAAKIGECYCLIPIIIMRPEKAGIDSSCTFYLLIDIQTIEK